MTTPAGGAGSRGAREDAVEAPFEGAEPGAEPAAEPAAEADELAEETADEVEADELARVTAERDEYLDALRRLQAEFDNYRKRTVRQQTELLERAAVGLVERLLPVLDAIDLAVAHRTATPAAAGDGGAFDQVAALLQDVLAKDGLERIDVVGVPFDPAVHEAVAHLPGATAPEAAAGGLAGGAEPSAVEARPDGEEPAPVAEASGATVVEVLRAGYRLKGRILRPAMVAVQG